MITFVLCNIFERIWYSESILVTNFQIISKILTSGIWNCYVLKFVLVEAMWYPLKSCKKMGFDLKFIIFWGKTALNRGIALFSAVCKPH